MTKYYQAIFAAIAILAGATGCNNMPRFVYSDNVTTQSQVTIKKNLIVLPLKDGREMGEDQANWWLEVIPLLPYGYADYTFPETAKTFAQIHAFRFTPCEDLSKAAMQSMKKSGLFADVKFMYASDEALKSGDYVLSGELKSVQYSGKKFTYGLTLAGPCLWLLGAPTGTSMNQLIFDLTIQDKTGRIVWKYEYAQSKQLWQGFYYNVFKDCSMYSPMMAEAMQAAIKDLQTQNQLFR